MKRFSFIFLSLLLLSCGENKHDTHKSKPLFQLISQKNLKAEPGYDNFIKSCTAAIKNERTCRCQADILKNYLKDNDIDLVARAGSDAKQFPADLNARVKKAAVQADRECVGLEK